MKTNSNRKPLAQETRKLIKKAEAKRPPKLPKIKWVDASKMMPPLNKAVLIHMPYARNNVWIAYRIRGEFQWLLSDGVPATTKVTHWAYPEAH